jgi:hypothetical protein
VVLGRTSAQAWPYERASPTTFVRGFTPSTVTWTAYGLFNVAPLLVRSVSVPQHHTVPALIAQLE